MDVIDFNQKKEKQKHHKLLPNSIRGILVGPSGSGKTNLLINLILQPGWLDWDRIYIVSPTVEQEIWDLIREFNDYISLNNDSLFSLNNELFKEGSISFHSIDDAPDPDDLDEENNNLIVFDDCMLENQKAPAKLFSRGHHKNADTLYLFQKYTEVPKVLRDNCNFIILFNGVDGDALRTIHRVWCSGDLILKEFKTWFSESTCQPHSFVVIDLTEKKKKYRKGFDKLCTNF